MNATLANLGILAVILQLASVGDAKSGETVNLTPKVAVGDMAQVVIELEVGGDLKVRDQSAAETPTEQGPTKTVPMSVNGTVEYDERLLPGGDSPLPRRAARYYRSAEAVLKIEQGGETRKLPANLGLVLVDAREEHPSVVSMSGPLDRNDLDLIDQLGNTTTIHELLPAKGIADGETWPMEAATIQRLLGLDGVALCEVQSVLDDVNSSFARIRFTGQVNGTVDGAATELALQGVYLFDRKLKRISQLNLAIKEVRSISPASPGLDAVAKLRIKLKPISESAELSDAFVAELPAEITDEMQLLALRDEKLGFAVSHDRQWYITGDRREQKTLRRIDADGLVAQCTLSKLPPQSADRATTLEEFVRDIKFALGKNFKEVASSQQWTNAHGERCMSAVVHGQVDGVPVEWRYYHLSPELAGARLSVVVTVEQAAVARLGAADRELVNQIDLLPGAAAVAPETASRILQQSVLKRK